MHAFNKYVYTFIVPFKFEYNYKQYCSCVVRIVNLTSEEPFMSVSPTPTNEANDGE